MDEPSVVDRAALPYVAVTGTVTMQTFPDIADRLPEVFGFLAERGLAPAGAPFFRYRTIDMERALVVEAGVPVAAPVAGAGTVAPGELPAGRYASVVHVGHPDELIARTGDLLDWAERQGLAFDVAPSPEGDVWGCRLEVLLTNPAEEPDMRKWSTELAFRLAD